MSVRPVAVAIAALLLALSLPTSGAQDTQPAHCRAVSLSSFQEYSLQNVRMVWDGYTIDSKGVCIWEKTSPPNTMPTCRYGVQLATPTFGWYANLCWWGTPSEPLRSTLTLSDVRRVVEDLVGRPQVQDRLGPGQHIVELDIGGNLVSVVTRDGKVATIEGKVLPPAKCYTTYLGGYLEYSDPRVKATWDEYSADSVGVCRWDAPDRPLADQCNHMVEIAGSQMGIPSYWLCWWGKLVGISSHDGLEPDITIQMDRDAWLAVANAADPGTTALSMARSGYIVFTFEDPATQAGMKAALNLAGDSLGATLDPPTGDLIGPGGSPFGIEPDWIPPPAAIPTSVVQVDPGFDSTIEWTLLVDPEGGQPGRIEVWRGAFLTILQLPPPPPEPITLLQPYPEPGVGAGWQSPPLVGPPESILDDIGEHFPPPESILDDVDPPPTPDQLRIMFDLGALAALQDRHYQDLAQQQDEPQDFTLPWYAGSTGLSAPLRPDLTNWAPSPLHGGLLRGQGYYSDAPAGVIQ